MAKPILIIRVSSRVSLFGGRTIDNSYVEIAEALEKRFEDYHVFVIPDYNSKNREGFKFETFYEKDQEPIDHKTLKEMITSSIK